MTSEDVLTIAAALSAPNRLNVVLLLERGALSVGELAECLGVRHPCVSFHVTRLKQARIVEVRKKGRRHVVRLRQGSWTSLLAGFYQAWGSP